MLQEVGVTRVLRAALQEHEVPRSFLLIATFATVLLVGSIDVHPARAGAWMRGPGHGYAKVAVVWVHADERLGADGGSTAMPADGHFNDAGIAVYTELGLLRHLDLVLATSLKRITVRDDTSIDVSTAGLADLQVDARLGALRAGPVLTAVIAGVKLPTGYRSDETPPLGTGAVDGRLRIAVSGGWPRPFPGYLSGEVGYRWRGDLADDLDYLVELGVGPGESAGFGAGAWLRVKLEGVDSRGARHLDPAIAPELTSREEDFVKVGPELSWPLDREATFTLEVGARWVVDGKNTIASRDLIFGVASVF
jgi:hypothetical protein